MLIVLLVAAYDASDGDSAAFLPLMMPLIADSVGFVLLMMPRIANSADFMLLLAVHLLRASSTPGVGLAVPPALRASIQKSL